MTAPLLNNIHLKHEFDELLQAIGRWVVVRSYDRTMRCSCARGGAPVSDCPSCEGAGRPFAERPSLAYSVTVAAFSSLQGQENTAVHGSWAEDGIVFFLPTEARVSHGDRIYEVAQRVTTGRRLLDLPIVRLSKFDVSMPGPMHADRRGEYEFQMVCAIEQEGR